MVWEPALAPGQGMSSASIWMSGAPKVPAEAGALQRRHYRHCIEVPIDPEISNASAVAKLLMLKILHVRLITPVILPRLGRVDNTIGTRNSDSLS